MYVSIGLHRSVKTRYRVNGQDSDRTSMFHFGKIKTASVFVRFPAAFLFVCATNRVI